MTIKTCTVKITSKKEFESVERICLDAGYGWICKGHPRRDYGEFIGCGYNGIYVDGRDIDITACSCNNMLTTGNYTADEFIAKYGKKHGKKETEKRYRFKTEREFIDEFGDDWRNICEDGFYTEMDCLFGKRLSKEHNRELIDDGETMTYNSEYTVLMDMVTLCKPETKTKPKLMDRLFKTVTVKLNNSLYTRKRVYLDQTN